MCDLKDCMQYGNVRLTSQFLSFVLIKLIRKTISFVQSSYLEKAAKYEKKLDCQKHQWYFGQGYELDKYF